VKFKDSCENTQAELIA